jgi:hypothetical protein
MKMHLVDICDQSWYSYIMNKRDTALDFTSEEISMWGTTTQAVSEIANVHFDVFNEAESGKLSKAKTAKARKALGTLYRAAAYLRATCNPTAKAYDSKFLFTKDTKGKSWNPGSELSKRRNQHE